MCEFVFSVADDGKPLELVTRDLIDTLAPDRSKVERVVIPESVKEIGARAFKDCNNLKSLTLPDSVVKIGYGAFSDCTNLKELFLCPRHIPNFIERISAFAELKCISYSPNAFRNFGELGVYKIPEQLTEPGKCAFMNCKTLKGVIFSGAVDRISSGAFRGCTGLTEIVLPDGVEEIDSWAFENCTSLRKVVVPKSCRKIGFLAFSGCTALEDVAVSKATEIDGTAFYECNPNLRVHE